MERIDSSQEAARKVKERLDTKRPEQVLDAVRSVFDKNKNSENPSVHGMMKALILYCLKRMDHGDISGKLSTELLDFLITHVSHVSFE